LASCVRNIFIKNYQNLIIGFEVTVENVGNVFWDTVYICWLTVGFSSRNRRFMLSGKVFISIY